MDLLSQGRKILPDRFPRSCLASLHGIYLSDFSHWHKMSPSKSGFPQGTAAAIWLPCRSKSPVKTASPRSRCQGKSICMLLPTLRSELQSCVSEKTPVLLVDFSAVDYIDSSGLATFIEYLRDATAYEGKIALFGMKQKVRTIFDLVRLNELFTIADSADAAVAALASK